MITIDIIDDNKERSAERIANKYPMENNRWNGGYDAAYVFTRGYYTELLSIAEQERRAHVSKGYLRSNRGRMREALFALNRIARALTAWF
jgi:hypothetical protein